MHVNHTDRGLQLCSLCSIFLSSPPRLSRPFCLYMYNHTHTRSLPPLIWLGASHFPPQSDTSQQDPADMVQWLPDLFAPLSKVETVSTTQQHTRDSEISIWAQKRRILCVKVLSVCSTVVTDTCTRCSSLILSWYSSREAFCFSLHPLNSSLLQ